MQSKDETQEKILSLLIGLERLEEFRLWRDEVAKPIIDQLETELQDADSMSEAVLRAKLKHAQSMKYVFYSVFDQVRIQKSLQQDSPES